MIASQELGDLGRSESEPVFFRWRWHYYFPSLPLWGVLVLLLVLLPENRKLQAWLMLIPPLCVAALWQGVGLAFGPSEGLEGFGYFLTSLTTAWAAAWLLSHRLSELSGTFAFLGAWAIMLASGVLSGLSYFGTAGAGELSPFAVFSVIGGLALLLATTLSGFCCRGAYRPRRFMAWQVLWMVLATAVALTVFVISMVALRVGGRPDLPDMIVMAILVSFVMGGILYLLNLPVMVLVFRTACYRDRFRSVLRLQDVRERDFRYPPIKGDGDYLSVSTDPTTKPVAREDVVGRWQFYLDSISRTVILDFKPDGTYAQTISGNASGVRECPGGEWRLEGPTVHVSGYVTAGEGTGGSRAWWMIDTPGGLALFGGDGPEPAAFYRMTRAPQPAEWSSEAPSSA